MSKATVAACYQHSIAVPVLHMASVANQLGKEEEQDGRDGDDADDLADEENRVHVGL